MICRAGVILASYDVYRELRQALPPGHAVLATRRDPGAGVIECLVEGPLLPETTLSAAPVVQLFLREAFHPEHRVVAWFSSAPDDPWTVNVSHQVQTAS